MEVVARWSWNIPIPMVNAKKSNRVQSALESSQIGCVECAGYIEVSGMNASKEPHRNP